MKAQQQEIKANQKAIWNKFSPGWKKWDDLTMNFIQPHGDALIHNLDIQPGDKILDVAGGTGEPGLTIASMLSGGTIIISDLSEGMLEVAKEKAEKSGVSNVEFMIADACELPFDDNSFDKVSCRLGLMFVPDIRLAVEEMFRVLKPGGKFATTVWGGEEKNYWATCMPAAIGKYVELEKASPGAPGIFRCAEPGMMTGIFNDVGFKNVHEEEIPCVMKRENGEEYWDIMKDVAAPMASLMSNADEETINKIHQEVVITMDQHYPNGHPNGTGILISGIK